MALRRISVNVWALCGHIRLSAGIFGCHVDRVVALAPRRHMRGDPDGDPARLRQINYEPRR
jgi:hypothetical protein